MGSGSVRLAALVAHSTTPIRGAPPRFARCEVQWSRDTGGTSSASSPTEHCSDKTSSSLNGLWNTSSKLASQAAASAFPHLQKTQVHSRALWLQPPSQHAALAHRHVH